MTPFRERNGTISCSDVAARDAASSTPEFASSQAVRTPGTEPLPDPMPADVAVLFTLLMRQMDRLRERSLAANGQREPE